MVFDRGYTDYQWYQELTEEGVRFVTRLKHGAVIHPGAKRRGRKSPGVLEDRKIQLKGVKGTLCKVRFLDESTGEEYEFLTNAPGIPATTVAALYKERWQVELFFKWIKQHLKVKSFVGTSMNEVRTQLWIALCAYLLVAFTKFPVPRCFMWVGQKRGPHPGGRSWRSDSSWTGSHAPETWPPGSGCSCLPECRC